MFLDMSESGVEQFLNLMGTSNIAEGHFRREDALSSELVTYGWLF